MNDETGFAEVPWDVFSLNVSNMDELPAADPTDDDTCCESQWSGPTDSTDEMPWSCSRRANHLGTHWGEDGTNVLAEWRDEDARKVTR